MSEVDLNIKKNIVLAYQNHQKNNLKVAENIYKKILKTNPNHFESIFLLGTLLIQTGNFSKAIQLLKRAITGRLIPYGIISTTISDRSPSPPSHYPSL